MKKVKLISVFLGRSLVNSMSRESSKDILDTIKGIHTLLDSIELKQVFNL